MADPQSQVTNQVAKTLELIEQTNIADNLDDDKLAKIGSDCKAAFDEDLKSRSDWQKDMEEWVKVTAQYRENKCYPWENASNVKYPLISTAAMQFSARAYPSLVPGDGKIVKSRIYGKDPSGEKAAKADRVSTYMNFQMTYDMPYWETDMDKMLMSLAVFGMMFKKTYYDVTFKKIHSKLIPPADLVVDYWAQDLDTAERISEILYLAPRDVVSRKKSGAFLDIDYDVISPPEVNTEIKNVASGATPPSVQETTPYQFIEQHCWLDLNDDKIFEPYIVTFHYKSAKVARITARFSSDDIILNGKRKLVAFNPIQYYTKFSFIPNPDGSFYDMGFGSLLGPLNEAVNTLVNQLIDSGTINNLQSGWIGKGLRIKTGEQTFKPGEWKVANAVGDDLRKQIVPLPTKEPSNVLFQLLGMLVQSGKELASVAEIFTGKLPGQNTPATTTQETIEQGMKVFTAIYKRVYRSLEKEFKKVYRLNKIYLQEPKYVAVLDTPVEPTDFDESSYDICPAADPTASTQMEKLQKAMALVQILQLGTLDPMKVTIRLLEAQEQPNWQELIPGMAETGQPTPQQPPPDPKVIAMEKKMELEGQKAQLDMAKKQQEMEMNQRSKEMELAMEAQMKQMELQGAAQKANLDARIKSQQAAQQMQSTQQKLALGEAQYQQKMRQTQEAEKLSKNSSTGKTTQSRKQSKRS